MAQINILSSSIDKHRRTLVAVLLFLTARAPFLQKKTT